MKFNIERIRKFLFWMAVFLCPGGGLLLIWALVKNPKLKDTLTKKIQLIRSVLRGESNV